jgi:uncharacterized protein (UPF0333 family)
MSKRAKIVLQLLGIIILIAVIAWAFNSIGAFRSNSGPRRITFRVEASGGYANITLQAGKERIDKATTVTTPWERSIMIDQGEQVYLTASNPTQTGQLSCSISINGRTWKSEKIETPQDGVACAGIVP